MGVLRSRKAVPLGILAASILVLAGMDWTTASGDSRTDMALPVLALSLLVALFIFAGVFSEVGFTRLEVWVLILASVVGGTLPVNFFDVGLVRVGRATVAINLVGAGVPLWLSVRILLSGRVGPLEALVGLLFSIYAAYEISTFDPSVGILVDHFTLVPLVSALVAVLVRGPLNTCTPPLAYFYGSMGVLVGADVMRLPAVVSYDHVDEVMVSIGGVGVADAVFMAGITSIAMDLVISYYREGAGEVR